MSEFFLHNNLSKRIAPHTFKDVKDPKLNIIATKTTSILLIIAHPQEFLFKMQVVIQFG